MMSGKPARVPAATAVLAVVSLSLCLAVPSTFAFPAATAAPGAGQPAAGAQAASAAPARRDFPPDFMGPAGIAGWVLTEAPRAFAKDSLYGYVDGGAEIFLQYGFRNLWVYRFLPEKPEGDKEITLELYRMASPAAAFGIFSTRREGNEPVSPSIRTTHWLGREQTNMVKGDLYANILAAGCTQDEVAAFAMSLDRHLPAGDTLLPRAFFCMPEFNLIRGSERYICGGAAAANESPLLGADFWGFKEGRAEAYSVKYGPGGSKLVLIRFKEPPRGLWNDVLGLFGEYLLGVTVLHEIMQGQTVAGRRFYFGWSGLNGILVTDEPDPEVARVRIQLTLKMASRDLGHGPGRDRRIP